MNRRYAWFPMLAAAGAFFFLAGSGSSQNAPAPGPVPFRSADGKITGWKISIPGNRPLASAAIAGGKVFVGGGFGSHEFYAFDAITGKRLWTYQTADDGPTAAVVEDGIIAFNTESCELEIITTNGHQIWKKWLGDPLMSMPAIAGGNVYMAYPNSRGDGKYYVAAFDLKTGAELWKRPLAAEIMTAPVIDHDRLYAATVDGSMLSLNRQDGSTVWQEAKNATSAPAVWNGQCYFSRRDPLKSSPGGKAGQQTEVVAIRSTAAGVVGGGVKDLPETRRNADYLDYSKQVNSLKEQKSKGFDAAVGFAGPNKGAALMAPAMANIGKASVHGIWSYQGSKPFIAEGRLYSSMGGTTQSVEPLTGKVIWSRNLNEGVKAATVDDVATPPAIVNGKEFIGTTAGEVYALSAMTGEVLWKVDLGEPVSFQPTVAGGRVYVSTDRGSLFCLTTGDARDDGWPMWGGNTAHNGLPEK